jgi:threonine dehydratase
MAAEDYSTGDNEYTLWLKLVENTRVLAEASGATDLSSVSSGDNETVIKQKVVHNLYQLSLV